MTLEERKVIWNRRKEARRKKMIRSILVKAGLGLLALAGILTVVLIFSNSAKAKEEKVYYKYYTSVEVMPGDTLTSIAKEHMEGYDSVSEYIEEVKFMNRISNVNAIQAGRILHIPCGNLWWIHKEL